MGLKELPGGEGIPEGVREQTEARTLEEIAEDKGIESDLRGAKQMWDSLTQNSGNIIMIIDSESLIQEIINPVPPYKPEDVVGKSVYKFIPEEQHEISRTALRKAFEEGEPTNFEISSDVPQAGRMWFRTNVIPVKDGGKVTKVIQVVKDITNQKKLEDDLRESEERYRVVFEGSADGILVADIKTMEFRYANPAICRMLGYSMEELIGKGVGNIHPQDRLGYVISEFEAQARGQKALAADIPCLRKDGTIIYTDINTTKIVIDGKEYNVGFFRDTTERRKLEAKVAEAQKMDSIGNLAGGVAHDFNNMLAGILGYADLLLMTETDPAKTEDLRRIKEAANKASALTQKLLAFGRRGKHLIQPVNLNDVAGGVYSILECSIDKSVRLETSLEGSLYLVDGDPSQLNQVVMNLCVNAKEAMPEGGTLTVQTRNMTLDDEFCRTHPKAMPGRYILLSVTDTGCGMDKETQRRAFEPFFTTKREGKVQGNGLGLATVYGIVRNHRGFVDIYSEVGEGTTFRVYLPAGEKGQQSATAGPAEEIREGKGTILVVEDEDILRAMAQRMLGSLGYNVITAGNGREGVEIYGQRHSEIDAVILDMVMPEMGGEEAFARMKEINPDIRALLSSGYSQNGKAQEVIDLGAKGFIQKPYDVADISRKIAELLE